MRKNILQPAVKKELVGRIGLLRPNIQRQWGKMNVNQMLLHCTDGIKVAYGDVKVTPKKTGWFHNKMVRYFILYTNVATPKETTPTYPELNMVEQGINPGNFTELKSNLIDAVNTFSYKDTLPVHPFLGKFTTENWGRMMYTHIDHHLQQFGV